MKRHQLLFLFLALSIVFGCKDKIKIDGDNNFKETVKIQKIDSLLKSLVTNGHSAGIAYGIQIGDQKIYQGAYGIADMETGRVVDTATVFGLASITKPFTAIAIGQLVEKGKLSLEDKLVKFFPDFPKGEKVTLYQLLSHTSGINEWWVGGLPESTPEDWTTSEHPHEYLQQMKNVYLFEPGSEYSYSNMGYLLLGEIVEQVSGKHYSNYVKENIFDIVGMTRTDLVQGEETFESMAKGYGVSQENDSSVVKSVSASPFIAGALKSFGGLKSNVPDMILWSKALFNEELINQELLTQMMNYAKVKDGRWVYEAKYVHPDFPPPPPWEYMKKDGYGLGFSRTEIFGKEALWHSGGMPGYNTLWFYFPELETSLVALSNTDNGIIPVFEQLMSTLLDAKG